MLKRIKAETGRWTSPNQTNLPIIFLYLKAPTIPLMKLQNALNHTTTIAKATTELFDTIAANKLLVELMKI
jgi:hypothetical protein